LLIKGAQVAGLKARRSGEHLELRLDSADLAVDIGEESLRHLPNVALDLRPLIIDCAEDSETRKRYKRQRGRDGHHREPCLNADTAAPHE
jgi:hypothetical protein